MLMQALTPILISIMWLTQVKESHAGHCQLEEVKQTEQEQYFDQRYYRTNYREIYKTLYSFAICQGVNITAREELGIVSENLKYIVFNATTAPLIPVGIFRSFTSLDQLYLNSTSVEKIDPGAFTGLTNLEELYLQDNSISKLSKGIFNSLPHLKILNLSNNSIEAIEENSFLGLFVLRELFLNNNKIQTLLDDTFEKLTDLESIDLSHNLLSNISANLLSHLNVLLSNLDLSYNDLTDIDFSGISSSLKTLNLSKNRIHLLNNWTALVNLEHLDLSNNNIDRIEGVFEKLLYLNLSGNQIRELVPSLYKDSKYLITLDLSRNLMGNISEDIFVGLSELNYLYLQNNSLIHIPIGCLRDLHSLRLLNLSSNSIDEFEFGTFASLSLLETLDVSNNKLTYLDESAFHPLKQLKVLNIEYNYITSFDPHDLLGHSTNFSSITLDNNPWSCKSLLNVVKTLEKSHVHVTKGASRKNNHIHGIACLNYKFNGVDSTSIADFGRVNLNANIAQFLQEVNTLQKFFNSDFLNSSFYKYFENFNITNNLNQTYMNVFQKYFDEGFKNSTFYKYFDTNNVSSFNQRQDESFSSLIRELHLLADSLKNSSSSHSGDFRSKELSKYFNGAFENSSFYRYFSKDFSSSEFFKYFNENLPMKIDSDLSKIQNYFDTDFKNSTFYSFFEKDFKNLSRILNNVESNFSSTAYFSPYVDNTMQAHTSDVFVSKLTESFDELKVRESIFMTLVVLVLVGILLLLVFKNIHTRFSPKLYTAAAFKTAKSNENKHDFDDSQVELV